MTGEISFSFTSINVRFKNKLRSKLEIIMEKGIAMTSISCGTLSKYLHINKRSRQAVALTGSFERSY